MFMNVCICIIYEDFRIKFHHLPLVNCFANSINKTVTVGILVKLINIMVLFQT